MLYKPVTVNAEAMELRSQQENAVLADALTRCLEREGAFGNPPESLTEANENHQIYLHGSRVVLSHLMDAGKYVKNSNQAEPLKLRIASVGMLLGAKPDNLGKPHRVCSELNMMQALGMFEEAPAATQDSLSIRNIGAVRALVHLENPQTLSQLSTDGFATAAVVYSRAADSLGGSLTFTPQTQGVIYG